MTINPDVTARLEHRADPAVEFRNTRQEIDMLFDRLYRLSMSSPHDINVTDPGTCPACHAEDTVRELDWALRWNTLYGDGEHITISQDDGDFETAAYFCYECGTPLRMPDVRVTWS